MQDTGKPGGGSALITGAAQDIADAIVYLIRDAGYVTEKVLAMGVGRSLCMALMFG